jgi:hypothetical protein
MKSKIFGTGGHVAPFDEKLLVDELEAFATEEVKAHRPFVVQQLESKARIYEERNKLYGDNYKRFGPIMKMLLANQSLNPADADQMNRLGVFTQLVSKVTRYAENFTRGGHDDSLDDLAVYAMMLKELDNGEAL